MKLFFMLAMISTFVICGLSQRPYVYNNLKLRQPLRRPSSSTQQKQRPRPYQTVVPNVNSPETLKCTYNGQVLPNAEDSRQYSVCIRLHQNSNVWLKYSYTCPMLTFYDAVRSQCLWSLQSQLPAVTTRPAATVGTTESSNRVVSVAQASTSSMTEVSNKMEVTTVGSMQTEVITEVETSTLQFPTTIVPEELSSSSSEDVTDVFLTHPPHFTRPDHILKVPSPVPASWPPALPPSRPQRPETIVYNPNLDRFKTSTNRPDSISNSEYEKLTNSLHQHKLPNAFPQLSAAQRLPNTSSGENSSKGSVTDDNWSFSGKEPEASTRFPERWRPKTHLNKSSHFES